MCELDCMTGAFLVPLDGIFAAKARSLNHCNKADPSQSFDSSETGAALALRRSARFSTRGWNKTAELTNADLHSPTNATACEKFVRSI